jgi:tRNA threonylcarbamoyladenosine biosynthesis protein TsaE
LTTVRRDANPVAAEAGRAAAGPVHQPHAASSIEVRRLQTSSAAETEAVGAELAGSLKPGDVVLIGGELGSGKTTFVRGACRALGVTGIVTSPTFTVGQRYPGPVPVSHIDLYRIEHLEDEEPELLSDYLDGETIAFIEWPRDQLGGVGRVAARVRITHAGGDRREIEIT